MKDEQDKDFTHRMNLLSKLSQRTGVSPNIIKRYNDASLEGYMDSTSNPVIAKMLVYFGAVASGAGLCHFLSGNKQAGALTILFGTLVSGWGLFKEEQNHKASLEITEAAARKTPVFAPGLTRR